MMAKLITATVPRTARFLVELAVIGFTYFALAKLGLKLALVNPSASPVWPPTGFALAVVLLRGSRVWPALFIAALLANATAAGSVYTSLAIASGNTLEALVGSYLIRSWCKGWRAFSSPEDVIKFALVTMGPAAVISASVGVGALRLGEYINPADIGIVWVTWWMGDAASALVLTPAIILWAVPSAELIDRKELARSGAQLAAACAVGLVAFSPVVELPAHKGPLGFLAVAPLLWAALRRGQRDTATVGLVLACFAIWAAAAASGTVARPAQNESFLLVLMFVIGAVLPSLALSAEVAVRQQTEQALRESEGRQRLLIAELDHRVKNTLATVAAVVERSRQGAPSVDALAAAVESRIHTMARTHSRLSCSSWAGAALRGLIEDELAPYLTSKNIIVEGPELVLVPHASQAVSMVLHELATNAAKYGALSAKDGKVSVTWAISQDDSKGSLNLVWQETGGPRVSPPTCEGFGMSVIRDLLGYELNARVDLQFASEGLRWQISIPLARATNPGT